MIRPLNRNGTWRTYSLDAGLAGLRVEHIAEDSYGNLWFATWDNGASRFDGDGFRNFTRQDGLVSDSIYFILRDSRDRLWFGTYHGVCWYDGAGFHYLDGDGVAGRPVTCIYEDREGRIWLGGNGTMGYCSGDVFHDMLPRYRRQCERPPYALMVRCWGITEDPQGHLWFGFDYLIRFDGECFHRYEAKDGFPQDLCCYLVDRDPAGSVWIGRFYSKNELWCYTDGGFQSVQVDLGGNLRRIQCDRDGRMWVCTAGGVHYQDGGEFIGFPLADGGSHPAVKAVFQDRDKQFWFATWSGVIRYDASSINVFDLGDGFPLDPHEVTQLVQDRRGDIWIGYASPVLTTPSIGLARFDGRDFTFLGPEQGFHINCCFSIYEDHEGNLWFGGLDGLFRYDGQAFEKIAMASGSGERSICAITQDSQGQFLFGYWEVDTDKPGLRMERLSLSPIKVIYQRGEAFETIFSEDREKDVYDRIGAVIAGRNGEIYFHMVYQSFSISDRGLARWHPDDGLKFYGIEDGLIDCKVNDLVLDRTGNLWIAASEGLVCFDGHTFRTFTTEDGLPNNRIRCLFEDRQGHIWMGTDGGVAHYNGQLFQTINSPHIGPVFRILEDRDGSFWFGTVLGSIIRYRQLKTPPRIRMLQVVADQVYENLEEDIVSPAAQQVIFEYRGMSFSTPSSDIRYICRLKGRDTAWRPATSDRRVYYSDLLPGEYTFQVRAVDRDLNYSKVAKARLTITPDPRIEAFTAILNRRGGEKFIGQSAALRRFQVSLRKVADTDITVLILGETGTGKGLAARALHALSRCSDGPNIEVSCGALPAALIDSELFGHVKGAFTSAVSHRLGRVELAAGGTLFLDEIGEMSMETQFKLLRLLEEGTFERVGSSEPLTARTRIVAATNRNLEEMVGKGAFREDLYYRLNAFPLYLPPLRERKEDIPALAEFFSHRMAAHLGKEIDPLAPEVLSALQNCDWPGNVRELEHTIQRAVVLCVGSRVRVEDLALYRRPIKPSPLDTSEPVATASQHGEILSLEEFERRYIISVLEATNWRIGGARGAATLLGLPPSTLYSKMKKLGIRD